VATFEEQLRGGTQNPNRSLDFTIEVTSDLSSYQNLAVMVDTGPTLSLVATSDFSGISGILQNAPELGVAIVRYGGISKAVYGATVAVDDILVIQPTTGKVIPLAYGSQGHVHAVSIRILRRAIYLVNDYGVAITGADTGTPGVTTGDFTVGMHWDDAGAFNAASEAVTITEIGSGYYWLSFTPTQYGSAYVITVEYADGGDKGIVTPSMFQEVPFVDLLGPAAISSKTIIGQALVAGVADEIGLILVRPQLF